MARPLEEIENDMCRWLVQHGAPDHETAREILVSQSMPYFRGLAIEAMGAMSEPPDPFDEGPTA